MLYTKTHLTRCKQDNRECTALVNNKLSTDGLISIKFNITAVLGKLHLNTQCLKKLCKFVFVRTSSNFH